MKRKILHRTLLLAATGFLLAPAIALADSIAPSDFSASIGIGESVTIAKTVTIDRAAASYAPVDVLFLADTTGSMGGTINTVQAGASSILTGTAGLGDVQYAVAEYEDWGASYGYPSDQPYTLHQDFTSDTAAVQAGITLWDSPLGYGGDGPESQMHALEQAATDPSWRTGSTRVLVWFGDWAGHDPSGPSTEASATTALVANNITVEAVSVAGSLGAQADRIAAATGGHHYTGIDTASIVAAITDAITTVIDEYSTVSLDLAGVPAGVDATVTPGSHTGAYDRSVTETFAFEVVLTGAAAGTYDFDIWALVDGSRVAVEHDSITVGDGGTAPVPEPGTMLLFGTGLAGFAGAHWRRKKSK